MSRRRFRGVVVGLSFSISVWGGIALTARAARAQDAPAEPPPESPPPAFVAPPPGYEPPTQYAQSAPPAPAPVEMLPTLMTLDRMDPTSRIGIQIGFEKIDRLSISDAFLLRFDPYGQYVFPNGQVGIYGQLPLSRITQSNQPDATGIGNIDLGAFFMPTHSAELILRAGLALSTATDNGDGAAANVVSGLERLTDLILAAPNYTTFRASVSTVQQSGVAFFRGDLGFDLAIDKPTGGNAFYLRANLAGGLRFTDVDLTAELVNWGSLDGDGSLENRFLHTAAFSVRTNGVNQLHLGTVFPLDDQLRGEYWIVSVGYQRAIAM